MIFCLFFYRKLKTKGLKVFSVYTFLLALFIVATLIATFVFKSRDLYLLNIRFYVVIEYSVFAYFFYNIYNSPFYKKIVLYSTVPFAIFCIYDYLISLPHTFSNFPLIIEFLAFIIFIIYFFYEKMQTVVLYPLYQTITFWICVALFIYFTGNFFFLIFLKSSNDPVFVTQMKIIYSFITISKNIILCLAFLGHEHVERTEDNLNFPTDVNLDEFSLTNYKNN